MTDDVIGILELDAHAYHDDVISAARPSLSKSIAHVLLTSSPAHARAAHPRLNPAYVPAEDEKFDLGTACHALMLEGRNAVAVVNADDWRTKAAKEERDAARAAGLIPLLEKHWMACQEMIAATREQLDAIEVDPPLFTDGKPEQTLVWEEKGVLCRARLDWLRDDFRACDDLKTTSRSASPDQWSRSMFGIGADLQSALYQRGMRAVIGRDIPFRFVVVETFPPFALAVYELGPDALAIADAKIDHALAIWRKCLASNTWPAYPPRVCTIEAPPWAEAQWLEREAREEMAA